jgi:lysophospholipase L1-like esterase
VSAEIPRAQRRRIGLLAALGATALALLCAEVGLRLVGYHALGPAQRRRAPILRISDDPELGYELRPLAEGRGWGTHVRVNSHGFRGPEVELDGKGRFRIVVLGDSITFGNRIPEGSAWPDVLQELLSANPARVQVLNFALGGYDVLQYVRTLETKALPFAPDLVVVGYCLNDAGVASTNLDDLRELEAVQSSFWLRSRLLQLLYTYDASARSLNEPELFRRHYAQRIEEIDDSESQLLALMSRVGSEAPASWYADRAKVGRLRYAFGRLAALSREHGFGVLVVVFPWLELEGSVYPHQAVHEIIAHEVRRAGLELFDLTPPFVLEGIQRLRLRRRELCHPNERGHRLIAETLRPLIVERWIKAR